MPHCHPPWARDAALSSRSRRPVFVVIEPRRRKAPRYLALLALVLLWSAAWLQAAREHPAAFAAAVQRLPGIYAETMGRGTVQQAQDCSIANNFSVGRTGVMLGRYAACD